MHGDRLTFLGGEESPDTPIVIWSQVAGNARRCRGKPWYRDASRDAQIENEGIPACFYWQE